ncbi:hypothetical protein MTO96_025365 [Rhipicephalus appendiculatus]
MYGVQSVRDVPFLNTLVSQPNAPPTPQPQPVLGSFSSADGDHVQVLRTALKRVRKQHPLLCPPPPPPLTYSSRVLEQGSTRQPSAISDANNDFAQTPSFSRAGARVTLDSEGKVIYSSNSLGRHRDGYTMTSGNAGLPGKCMTLPASMPPTPGSNQRAYVRLDPSGKVETYTSSTIPRTRYSVSGTPTSPDTRPPLLQYRDGMFTLSSPPNSTSTPNARSQFPLSGRSTPQPGMSGYVHSTASGRSTPQPGRIGLSKQSFVGENDTSSTSRINFNSVFQQAIRYKHSHL